MVRLDDGDIIVRDGYTFRVNIEDDDHHEPPWEWSDGHGPVSDWRGKKSRKAPGEVELCSDWGDVRYYDWQGAMALAKKDGWGLSPKNEAALVAKLGRKPTKGEIRAEAVRLDYEYLRGWCNDDWHYVGVIVTHLPEVIDEDGYDVTEESSDDVETDYGNALWGVESNCNDYLREVAEQLMDTTINRLKREAEEEARATALEAVQAEYWANHNVLTVES